MKPATSKTQLSASTQLRKAIFGRAQYLQGCVSPAGFIPSSIHFIRLLVVICLLTGLSEAQLWSQNLFISEFMAANNSGVRDADGEFSDWIEIYNPERAAVSLGGWHLSDDPLDLTKWQFPDVAIPGQGFVLVFASGKNRTDPQGELHANFSLDRDGEYLVLTRPDGTTKTTEFTPTYPRQLGDVSYGVSMATQTAQFVPPNGAARMLFPTNDQLGLNWTLPGSTTPLGRREHSALAMIVHRRARRIQRANQKT